MFEDNEKIYCSHCGKEIKCDEEYMEYSNGKVYCIDCFMKKNMEDGSYNKPCPHCGYNGDDIMERVGPDGHDYFCPNCWKTYK